MQKKQRLFGKFLVSNLAMEQLLSMQRIFLLVIYLHAISRLKVSPKNGGSTIPSQVSIAKHNVGRWTNRIQIGYPLVNVYITMENHHF
jgi:hypothetical protein